MERSATSKSVQSHLQMTIAGARVLWSQRWVASTILKQSTDAAQRAIRHYLKNEYDQFFIQAGISFELLGKARLAAIHPSLIIDKDFDSLLHACAAGKHSKRLPWQVKTITATEALRRCTQLHHELLTFESRLTLLVEYRNSTSHLGEVPEAEAKQLFRTYLAGSSVVAKGLELKPEQIFGEFAEMVSKQLDESLAEVQLVVAKKLAQAKDDFQLRYAGLNPEQLKTLVNVIESGYKNKMDKYYNELVDCPSCKHQGVVSGDFELDSEVDVDRNGSIEGGYLVVTLTPATFFCDVCGLDLKDPSELKAAGLPESIDIEDVAPADFYAGEAEY
jgi:hypothetical protein